MERDTLHIGRGINIKAIEVVAAIIIKDGMVYATMRGLTQSLYITSNGCRLMRD